ncbi:vacuolar fusion protein mon1 [Blastomyces gilchristii SLH14081]|uniref:Vacuolar fusion protein MON1 n=1 Tax=Blastomyces gilchristii (strain SLH14081) TaxID=559298 RepID=A0A179UPN3_BLAGS|nr:vacuolar fusion protein mon1 [Blastomyces gilchristii SLH14081]OAT09793.1 vacuolar fusion protein mon1 [Blastomyces gilchristii SLH14081]
MDSKKNGDKLPGIDMENSSLSIPDPLQNNMDTACSGSSGETAEVPPALPPRPTIVSFEKQQVTAGSSSKIRPSSMHNLQSKPTTALSITDINTQNMPDGSSDLYASTAGKVVPGVTIGSRLSGTYLRSRRGSDAGDSISVRSFVPGGENSDDASLFGDFPVIGGEEFSWTEGGEHAGNRDLLESEDEEVDYDFENEFDAVDEVEPDGSNSKRIVEAWKKKRKHFLILSQAGKPIYTRHGDSGLISDYIGIIQTIISFYEESGDALKSFSAGKARIVILSQGPLYLVAISRLFESDTQLRMQLEALYMQILSTLTLPSLNHLFSIRPSTDLRRPLQGTESLLSSLADSFTRGSPSTLLSALECLKIRKSHRQTINNTLLNTRAENLLYGLVVAGGRLVSVIRPKKHSLHPGDLQLIFNMIFEADGVKAGGGDSWIPVCLPGFNSSGYLYMYVSFLDLRGDENHAANQNTNKDDSVAIILISPDKESFYALREMRDSVVEQMAKNGSINVIKAAIDKGRPTTTDIIPGTVLRHFLYKSKANVQFSMASYHPDFSTILGRRRLLSTYHSLHSSVHAKHAHVRVEHRITNSMNALAWITPVFELYCVAGPNSNRNALSQSTSKIAQWAQQEGERLFIIGGAVF